MTKVAVIVKDSSTELYYRGVERNYVLAKRLEKKVPAGCLVTIEKSELNQIITAAQIGVSAIGSLPLYVFLWRSEFELLGDL